MPDLDDDLAFLFADAAAQQQQALSDGGQHHHPHDQHPPESFYDGQTAFSGEDYEPSKSEEPGGGPSGGSAAAAAAAAEGKRLRKSQRQPLSCTECTRCDKVIPCSNCIKRGKSDECHLEEVIKDNASTSRGPARHVQMQLDDIRTSTTSSIDHLSQRIQSLEGMFSDFLSRFSSASPGSLPQMSAPFNPVPGQPFGQPDELEGEVDLEADAAATLEFLSLGRSRAKTTGALVGTGRKVEWDDDGASESGSQDGRSRESSAAPEAERLPPPKPAPRPSETPAQSTSNASHPRPPHPSAPAKKKSTNQPRYALNLLRELPSEAVGRRLVQYDMDMVSWLHCAVHIPTFLSECELFWQEGAEGEVEVNKSWLALLFAVLASGLHHLPSAEVRQLFPHESVQSVLSRWFETMQQALHESNWMGVHSLYAIQAMAISVSVSNHLGHSDLYFTQLAAAIKIAQTLNMNHLGPDTYPQSTTSVDSRSLIVREVCKRTWWQLVIQDLFHLPFNRSCSISPRQFDTAPPFHCFEQSLSFPKQLQSLSQEVPTIDSHTVQLLKFALLVFRLFDGLHSSRSSVPYTNILRFDDEARILLAQAPRWMQLDANDNPYPLPANPPAWLEWQRNAYIISTSHKVIILHRPYLGRAFKDPRYKRSRDACVGAARRILRLLKSCEIEAFRKTWTVLAHATAASVILVMEYAHSAGQPTASPSAVPDEPLRLVNDAIVIFEGLKGISTIASKAVIVLNSLVAETLRKMNGGVPTSESNKRKASAHSEAELDRAVKVLRRAHSSSSSSTVTLGSLEANAVSSSAGPSDQAYTYAPLTPSMLNLGGYDSTPKLPYSTLPANTTYSPYTSAANPSIGGTGPLDQNLNMAYGLHEYGAPPGNNQQHPQFTDDEYSLLDFLL